MSGAGWEIRSARQWYLWLWLSPLVTIPTLAMLHVTGYGLRDLICPYHTCGLPYEIRVVPSILLSGLWHLVLLIPSRSPQSEFIRWHGRQAMLLAGVRTAVPALLVLSLGEVAGPLISIPVLDSILIIGACGLSARPQEGEVIWQAGLGTSSLRPNPSLRQS